MMSGWSHNVEKIIERGRRNSIELFTRIRTSSGGALSFSRASRNRNAFSDCPDPLESPDGPPIPKNYSAPTMQNLILEDERSLELAVVETNTLLLEKSGHPQKLVLTGHTKEVCIIPMNNLDDSEDDWRGQGNDHLGLVLSALYAKVLVVCGTGFSMAEVISSYIPVAFYDGFYLYLYFVSILFMTSILGRVIKQRAHRHARSFAKGVSRTMQKRTKSPEAEDNKTEGINDEVAELNNESFHPLRSSSSETSSTPPSSEASTTNCKRRIRRVDVETEYTSEKGAHFGSFYLRIGALAFGVGSMIYTGLEFGQYFELKPDEKCHSYVAYGVTPAVKMVFTFMQMYFIFLNSKMASPRMSLVNLFGLMHLIGTNLCVWLNVLVQETKHEILNFYNPDNKTITFRFEKAHKAYLNILEDDSSANEDVQMSMSELLQEEHAGDHARVTRGLKGPHTINECGRAGLIMGSIVQDAAPFLFPCTIEFSLICAAICYVMWKYHAKKATSRYHRKPKEATLASAVVSRSPHHYSVDCARANKGLFVGIFFLVLTIMSIIINLVLDRELSINYREVANLEVNITEIVLYTTASIAVLMGMFQVRVLRYSKQSNLELDNILLIVAQTGSLIFNVFTIISGHFKGEKLVLALALSKVVQLLLQTLFILDASKRVAATPEQARRKPGREVVTFLLITNLSMWLMNALEKSRGDSHPAQLQFYGVWGWTVITHISMPLAIFYRFHSTVCLCNVWKRAFKLKQVKSFSN